MIFCEKYQKSSNEAKHKIVSSVVSQLSFLTGNTFPNCYAQLLTNESKRRLIVMLVNAKLTNDSNIVSTLQSLESSLESDSNG